MDRRFTLAMICALFPLGMAAQETVFTPAENPFQDERPLKLGEPIALHVEVAETQFLQVTLTPEEEIEPGKVVKCRIVLTGQRPGAGKVEILPIFLLEDEAGTNLERLNPAPFKVKARKSFEYQDTVRVSGEALRAAAKLWIYLEVK